MSTTLGLDPEFMVYGHQEKRIVSALKVIGTDKHNPVILERGARMYADNALAECSMPPEETVSDMVNRIRDVLGQMSARIGRDYSLLAQASHLYQFDEQEMVEKRLWEIGCAPNFDVYERTKNLPTPFADTLRTGSFHIHIGDDRLAYRGSGDYSQENDLETNPNKLLAVKVLDIYLGCSSVIFDADETSPGRRKYYGRAGEFRPTPYGIEYRVLGNWALRCPETTSLCFEIALHAISTVGEGIAESVCEAVGINHPRKAINENNKRLAWAILKKVDTPHWILQRIFRKYNNINMQKSWGF